MVHFFGLEVPRISGKDIVCWHSQVDLATTVPSGEAGADLGLPIKSSIKTQQHAVKAVRTSKGPIYLSPKNGLDSVQGV